MDIQDGRVFLPFNKAGWLDDKAFDGRAIGAVELHLEHLSKVQLVQKFLVGGCQLNVPIDQRIREAGFATESLETFYMKGPRINSYLYLGLARSDGAR